MHRHADESNLRASIASCKIEAYSSIELDPFSFLLSLSASWWALFMDLCRLKPFITIDSSSIYDLLNEIDADFITMMRIRNEQEDPVLKHIWMLLPWKKVTPIPAC